MKKFVSVKTTNFRGVEKDSKVLVIIESNRISIKSNDSLESDVMFNILLDREVNNEIRDFVINDYHRANNFKIESYHGMSGCERHTLKSLQPIDGSEYCQPKKSAELYFSCNNKIEKLEYMWLGDFIEFYDYLRPDDGMLNQLLNFSTNQLKKIRKLVNYKIEYPVWCKHQPKTEYDWCDDGYSSNGFMFFDSKKFDIEDRQEKEGRKRK